MQNYTLLKVIGECYEHNPGKLPSLVKSIRQAEEENKWRKQVRHTIDVSCNKIMHIDMAIAVLLGIVTLLITICATI